MVTKSQSKIIQEYLDKGYKVRAVDTGGKRILLHIRCNPCFAYQIYVGKRGKLFEESE